MTDGCNQLHTCTCDVLSSVLTGLGYDIFYVFPDLKNIHVHEFILSDADISMGPMNRWTTG